MGLKDTGGMSAYQLGLARALARRGHLVDLFTRHNSPGEVIKEIEQGVRLISFDDGLGFLTKEEISPHLKTISAKLLEHIKASRLGYDYIFSHYWLSALVGCDLSTALELPHLVMFHTLGKFKNDSSPGEAEPKNRLEAEARLMSSSDLIVTSSKLDRLKIIKTFRIDRKKVVLLPAACDTTLFKPRARNEARERLGLKAPYIMIAVGRVEPIKGFDLLIQALSHIVLPGDWQLLIIGGDGQNALPGTLEKELQEMAISSHLGNRVKFCGSVSHDLLPLYYSAANLTVLPSTCESFGIVLLESLACGTPVVAGTVGVAPELLPVPGINPGGFRLHSRRPEAWAAALEKILLLKKVPVQEDLSALVGGYSWEQSAVKLEKHLLGLGLGGRHAV